MNGLVDEWVEKAEEDYRAAHLVLEADKPIPSVAAFHSQQCAEKFLKAYLTGRRGASGRGHNPRTSSRHQRTACAARG